VAAKYEYVPIIREICHEYEGVLSCEAVLPGVMGRKDRPSGGKGGLDVLNMEGKKRL